MLSIYMGTWSCLYLCMHLSFGSFFHMWEKACDLYLSEQSLSSCLYIRVSLTKQAEQQLFCMFGSQSKALLCFVSSSLPFAVYQVKLTNKGVSLLQGPLHSGSHCTWHEMVWRVYLTFVSLNQGLLSTY
jgi:hypothetical protein